MCAGSSKADLRDSNEEIFQPMQATCRRARRRLSNRRVGVVRVFRNQIVRFIVFTSFYLALAGAFSGALLAAQDLSAPPVDPKAALSPLVFDVSYFKSVNPAFAHLTDAQATSQWLNHGAAEGLRGHPLFWSKQYLAFYADLRAASAPRIILPRLSTMCLPGTARAAKGFWL